MHVSTTDFGGAYIAAKRINESMLLQGVDSKVLVRLKTHADSKTVPVFRNRMQRLVSMTKNYLNLLLSDGDIVIDQFGTDICHCSLVAEADVICLHWVNSFISSLQIEKLLELGKPIIWVMHDMWPYTGGCHYAGECLQYEDGCKACPETTKKSAIKRNYQTKQKYCKQGQLLPIGPSEWISECARKSKIFQNRTVATIPNPIDTSVFYPMNETDVEEAKKKYGLSLNKKTILFGAVNASNTAKGFCYFLDAVKNLDKKQYQILVLGNCDKNEELERELDVCYTGFVDNETELCEIYNAADVLVSSSVTENYSNTILESLSSGTPAVVFNIGGSPELVKHSVSGYVAKAKDAADMRNGIAVVAEKSKEYGKKAREQVLKNNTYEIVGNQYVKYMHSLTKYNSKVD